MKREIISVFLITTLLCSCSGGRDALDRPASSPPDSPSAAAPASSEPDELSSDSDGAEEGLGEYVGFPACGIKFRPPEGFEKQTSFDGFGQTETQSSVMASRFPGPYTNVAATFNREPMAARGWTLRSRDDVNVDGIEGVLVHFEQPAEGQVFLKWSLVFGDDEQTTMVTATFPQSQERELSARLKAAVLSTGTDTAAAPDAGTDLPFTLVTSQKLKLTPGINKLLMYTQDGVLPAKSPSEPLFLAAPALGRVEVPDKQQYAKRGLHQTAHTKNLALKTIDEITIDGLDGYELLAAAEDAQSGTPLFVYQVILFDEGSYILMQGLVGTELGDEYLPEFKAMARSLRRK